MAESFSQSNCRTPEQPKGVDTTVQTQDETVSREIQSRKDILTSSLLKESRASSLKDRIQFPKKLVREASPELSSLESRISFPASTLHNPPTKRKALNSESGVNKFNDVELHCVCSGLRTVPASEPLQQTSKQSNSYCPTPPTTVSWPTHPAAFPRPLTQQKKPSPEVSYDRHAIDFASSMANVRKEAANAIKFASWAQKKYFDAAHSPLPSIKEGDWVRVKYSPKDMPGYHAPNAPTSKLAPRYSTPYKVIRKVSPWAYELALPEGVRTHPVFSIAMLRPITSDLNLHAPEVPEVITEQQPDGEEVLYMR